MQVRRVNPHVLGAVCLAPMAATASLALYILSHLIRARVAQV